MKFLVATKENMTQVFDQDGKVYPATLLKVGPVVVTQVKKEDKDGYSAVQVGYGTRKEKNVNKPQREHTKGLGFFAGFREFAKGKDIEAKRGEKLDATIFEPGDEVSIVSTSKGKGFQGVVKRYGFAGGRRSHGQKHSEREPGSIGSTGPQRVFKGTRMGGRMGSDRITLRKVKILQVDKDNNYLVVNGSIPGRRGTVVEIRENK
jgi:large subunit ribosomal protein L3